MWDWISKLMAGNHNRMSQNRSESMRTKINVPGQELQSQNRIQSQNKIKKTGTNYEISKWDWILKLMAGNQSSYSKNNFFEGCVTIY